MFEYSILLNHYFSQTIHRFMCVYGFFFKSLSASSNSCCSEIQINIRCPSIDLGNAENTFNSICRFQKLPGNLTRTRHPKNLTKTSCKTIDCSRRCIQRIIYILKNMLLATVFFTEDTVQYIWYIAKFIQESRQYQKLSIYSIALRVG